MKYIIVIALLCSTAFAVPAVQKPQNPVRAFFVEQLQEWVPKLVAKDHTTTLAKVRRIHEAPGLKEVVEQFEQSATNIYNDINDMATVFVPFVQQYGLNDLILSRLPGVVVEAAADTYNDIVFYMNILIDLLDYILYPATPEQIVGMFIILGIFVPIVEIPTYTVFELAEILYATDLEAYRKFSNIIFDVVAAANSHLIPFFDVLLKAIENLENK